MRRKKGALIRVEQEILHAVLLLRRRGITEFHGFNLAKEIQELTQAERLRAHSTLYRALRRLEHQGYLQSRWENPSIAEHENRPRRRLYRLTVSESTVISKLDYPGDAHSPAWESPV